jgi:DNA-binding NarL/FixJ family response regulator
MAMRVPIVDDHDLVRASVPRLPKSRPDRHAIGVTRGKQAPLASRRDAIEVAVVDYPRIRGAMS